MNNSIKTIGIIGAGKVSIVLAQLALKAGYEVYISGSGDPQKIALSISVLAPGAHAATSREVAEKSDIVILAIPLGKYKQLPAEALKGKLVIDAMNYWWEVDGDQPELTDVQTSSSEVVQRFLHDSRIVKAFNHIGYHDLHDETKPEGSTNRKAIAIAGNNELDNEEVAGLVNSLGFDPIIIGPLEDGIKLQPGSDVFGAHVNAEMLKSIIESFSESVFGKNVLEARKVSAL
ncbi:MAG: NAD(P)-binding domain-containing protein [Patescibacteria group bacterium]